MRALEDSAAARLVRVQCTCSAHAVHMQCMCGKARRRHATSRCVAEEEVRPVCVPRLRRAARLGSLVGEVARTALPAEGDHLTMGHHGELVTEHRLEELSEERRLLKQETRQILAAVPAVEAATVALYNLCALHRQSGQPVEVRRQACALGLVTVDDHSE